MPTKSQKADLSGLLAAGDRAATKVKQDHAPIDFSHIGGKKVHPVPVEAEKEISFEHLGGKKVGHFKHDTERTIC